MTFEQVIALLQLIADLRSQIERQGTVLNQLQAENEELKTALTETVKVENGIEPKPYS